MKQRTRIRRGMTKRQLRAFVITWLKARGVETAPYRGLDDTKGKGGRYYPKRAHFECGCSIVKPGFRARHKPMLTHRPDAATRICEEHQRQLGKGEEL